MKTGSYIKMSYEIEIQRILIEARFALIEIQKEVDLFEIQQKVKVYKKERDGHLAIAFQPDGSIVFEITDSKRASSCKINDIEKLRIFLEESHLNVLKNTHPKRFHEVFMRASKKFLL